MGEELDWLFDWDVIQLSRDEFEVFRDVQIRRRCGWPATFSCNSNREVWPFATFSHTAQSDRLPLKGVLPTLDLIVKKVLETNPRGGTFHINDRGVFSADAKDQILEFDLQ